MPPQPLNMVAVSLSPLPTRKGATILTKVLRGECMQGTAALALFGDGTVILQRSIAATTAFSFFSLGKAGRGLCQPKYGKTRKALTGIPVYPTSGQVSISIVFVVLC